MHAGKKQFYSRWGDAELDKPGWLYIPAIIMNHYHSFKDADGKTVGLGTRGFEFMSQVMSFKWDIVDSEARPSLNTIAKRMGLSFRSTQRIAHQLRDSGAMQIVEKPGKPSIYEFANLVNHCRKCEKLTHDTSDTPDESVMGTHDTSDMTPMTHLTPEYKKKEKESSNIENVSSSSSKPKIIHLQPTPNEDDDDDAIQSSTQDKSGVKETAPEPAATEEKKSPPSSAPPPQSNGAGDAEPLDQDEFDYACGIVNAYYDKSGVDEYDIAMRKKLEATFRLTGQDAKFIKGVVDRMSAVKGVVGWEYLAQSILNEYKHPRPAHTPGPTKANGNGRKDYTSGKYAAFLVTDESEPEEETA